YSYQSGACRSRQRGSQGLSSALVSRRSSASNHTRTCYGTPAASFWPTRDTTPAPYRPISVTGIFSTPAVTPNWHRIGSRTFGDEQGHHLPVPDAQHEPR